MPAHATPGPLSIDHSAFHAITSVGGLQSKSDSPASQIALIGTAGSSSDDESSRLSSQISSDSLSRHDHFSNCSRDQRIKQLRDVRTIRLKKAATDEVIPLECSQDELASCLREEFEKLVRRKKMQAVTVYSVVLSSLRAFLERNGEGGCLESRVCDFLSARFIVNAAKTRAILEDEEREMGEVMVETMAMILLQLHVVRNGGESKMEKGEKTELVKKLRYIYIHNCASALRSAMEEEITDVFGSSLPSLVCDLFAEIGMDDHIPLDLEDDLDNARRGKDKSLSVSSTVSPAIAATPPLIASPKQETVKTSPSFGLKPSLSSRLEAMLDEFLEEEEPSSEGGSRGGGASQMMASSQIGEGKKESTQSQSHSQPAKRKAPPATPSRDERRPRARRVFVPETPDEKNGGREEGRKTRSQMKEEVKVIVKQTPMEKVMRVRKSTRGEKLAELIKTSSDSPSLTGGIASSLRSRAVKEEMGDRRSSLRNGNVLFPKEVKQTSREEFLSANLDGGGEKKSRVKVNVSRKLSFLSKAEEKKEEKRGGGGEERNKKKRKTDDNISALVLDADAISKYKKRMKETLDEGSKADDSEVFYGRMSNRVGLFDDRHEKEEAKVVYNRAGRVVYSPSCVFVAHTLLNVHNKSPLLPSKPSSSSAEFKLNRLVRPASKGNRLKLKKLKERLSLLSPKKEVKKESQ